MIIPLHLSVAKGRTSACREWRVLSFHLFSTSFPPPSSPLPPPLQPPQSVDSRWARGASRGREGQGGEGSAALKSRITGQFFHRPFSGGHPANDTAASSAVMDRITEGAKQCLKKEKIIKSKGLISHRRFPPSN